MRIKDKPRNFDVVNTLFLLLLALVCLLPFIHVLSVSLSETAPVITGKVGLFPKGLHLGNYQFVLSRPNFTGTLLNSLKRVFLGVFLNLFFAVLGAYPLSKKKTVFRGRTFFSWFFVLTMMISGGVIPKFLIVDATGLMDTLWSLVLPGAVNAFFIIVLLNFFRGIPADLEESAFLDGAGHFRVLFSIYLPLAIPALAALFIYSAMAHWNEFFEGMIYMDSVSHYPLSTYLRNIVAKSGFEVMNAEGLVQDDQLSHRAFVAAQMILASTPVLILLPFIQGFFMRGIIPGKLRK